VSYAVAAYGIAVGGVLAYLVWLVRTRARLLRALGDPPRPNGG
jgi:hypothetical protein